MFERFTPMARQVVAFAQQEAVALGHEYIGTEHLLLGLLHEEHGLAARVLTSLSVSVDVVRAEVARILGEGVVTITGQIPFTPRVKHVLELASTEADELGHAIVGTEHVLLALLREGSGVGVQLLADAGVTPESGRAAVLRALN